MTHQYLGIYMNDHLAGSVFALKLLARLEEAQAGTAIAKVLAALQADIVADRQELEQLIERLGVAESSPRKIAAWFVEHSAQLKLRLDDSGGGDMHLFESLEAVSLGIEGKRGLWQALAIVADQIPQLRDVDYDRLIQRAIDQRSRVEMERLRAATAALGTTPWGTQRKTRASASR